MSLLFMSALVWTPLLVKEILITLHIKLYSEFIILFIINQMCLHRSLILIYHYAGKLRSKPIAVILYYNCPIHLLQVYFTFMGVREGKN
jgi:hypothetical protein